MTPEERAAPLYDILAVYPPRQGQHDPIADAIRAAEAATLDEAIRYCESIDAAMSRKLGVTHDLPSAYRDMASRLRQLRETGSIRCGRRRSCGGQPTSSSSTAN